MEHGEKRKVLASVGSLATVEYMMYVPPWLSEGQQVCGMVWLAQSCDAPKLWPTSWAVVRTFFHVGTMP